MSLEISLESCKLTVGDSVITAKSLEDITVYMYKVSGMNLRKVTGKISEWEKSQLRLIMGQVKEDQVFHLFILYAYRASGDQTFRKQELERHQSHLREYLPKQKVKFTFVVVEQCNDLPFNKGLLLNIGFNEIYNTWKKGKNTDYYIPYFCIHNSDLFPKESTTPIDYTYSHGFRDSFGSISAGIGGIVVFDYLSYLRINGHPNDYYGWGGEDITVKNRITILNVPLHRGNYNNKECVEELDHPRDSSQNNANLQKIRTDDYKNNGIRQSNYTVLSKEMDNDIIYIKSTFS
jgi:hypothetical protein